MEQLKLELAKLGLITSWLGSGIVGAILGYNMVFANYSLFPMWLEIIGFVIFALLLGLQFPMLKMRNKYRDLVEYDKNGISRMNDFSNLSNQERREIEQQKLIKREMLIDNATLRNITKKGSDNPEMELNAMIGLKELKDEMHKMASKLAFEQKLNKKNKKKKKKNEPSTVNADTSYHMVFIGKAGTGKTTSTRIMSGFLYKYGIIEKNHYIEIDGNFFNGNTYGESTNKVKYILNMAKGGVLFIDEAYALLNSVESQEVIATIVAEMENSRSNLVIIFAGYDKEMKALINSNTGFQSRVKYFFHFKDYNLDELWEIFIKMSNSRGFVVNDNVRSNFNSYILEEMKKPNYGNARTVRTILDKAIDNHAVNYMDKLIDDDCEMRIVKEDLPVKKNQIKTKTVNVDEI